MALQGPFNMILIPYTIESTVLGKTATYCSINMMENSQHEIWCVCKHRSDLSTGSATRQSYRSALSAARSHLGIKNAAAVCGQSPELRRPG
ncbi:Maltose permease MAL61 [Fusarium oxysporum f. sp. albedinis]|nr:Maltose permease MAL61 [Fusarium oxysporum f. sp. albedinis]